MELREVKDSNLDNKCNHYSSSWDTEQSLEDFKSFLKYLVNTNKARTFYKWSDGEYYFLTNQQIGSVAKGRRDSNLINRNLTPFKEGVLKNDFLGCNLVTSHVDWFKEYFNKDFDYPVDYINKLVASNWFIQNFKVGLIGATEKLDLIKELCNHKEYTDFLGGNFSDYISVQQRYLCDNIEQQDKLIAEQLKNSDCDVYLVGIGHAQLALLHRMKSHKKAIYISIGSGIDAFAGVQDNDRPYMANWINFQLSNYDYSKIDIWKENFKLKKII